MNRIRPSATLVAREAQMTALREGLERACDGQSGTILLAGDAGAGKTRLIDELTAIAASSGVSVLLGHCIDLGGVGLPYLPFAEIHAQVSGGAEVDPIMAQALASRPALSGLVGQSATVPLGPDDVGRLQLFDAVGGLLADLASQRAPVLLVLEDLHWADRSTRELLHFLITRAREQRLLILGSYRTDDLHRRHPLRALLAELLRHASVQRVEVPPFTTEELRVFVNEIFPAGVTDEELTGVVERSGGNAYFAEELINSCTAQPGAGLCLPDSLADVLLTRVERLDSPAQQLVRLASVAGRRVSEPLLRSVDALEHDPYSTDFDEVLREVVHQQILISDDQESYAFRHALLSEAVYADLLPGERVRMHSRYARVIGESASAAGGQTQLGSAAELAHHSLSSHDLPAALSASVAAAEEASRRLAPAEALRQLESVLQLWAAVPDAEQRCGMDLIGVQLRAADEASRCGELERAVALARVAVDQAVAVGLAPAEATARRRLARHLLSSEMPGAWEESTRAVVLLAGESPDLVTTVPTRELLLTASVHARTCIDADRDSEACRWARWALRGSRALHMPGVEAAVLTTLAVLETSNPEVAADLLRQARTRAVDADDLGVELRSTYNMAANWFYTGDTNRALPELVDGRMRADATGATWSVWGIELRVLEVVTRYISGDWEGSVAAGALVHGRPPDLVAARLSAATLYVEVGRGEDGALSAAERLRPMWSRDGQIALIVGGCQADGLTWEGRPQEALAVAREAISHLARTWNDYFLGGIWLSALAVAALADIAERHQRPEPDEAVVAECRRIADELLEAARATASRGRHRHDTLGPEGVAWLHRVHAEHSRVYARADVATWKRCAESFGDGYPYEQARCRWRLAEALLADSDRAGASEQAQRAIEIATALGAAPLLGAVQKLVRRGRLDIAGSSGGPRGLLTARETAVLEVVAQGLTNRQAGEQLYISHKTVSVHLSSIMAKLGAAGRTEAVALAYQRGLLTPLAK